MPSPHSSAGTQADARAIVANLGAELIEIPIESAMRAYESLLSPSTDGAAPDLGPGPGTESARELETGGAGAELAAENIQARIRGNLMMALSNRFGWLVLTTGNKSEMSVGYATLYGDMAGGFAVIKDVPKTLVYRLVRYRNGLSADRPVPESVLERPPSAELRPDQRDEDSLPPYELLDRILVDYVEEDRGRDEIVADGVPAEVVDEVIAMVDRSEYKRRQAPPGIRITPKAFGRDRRLPITNRFRGSRIDSDREARPAIPACRQIPVASIRLRALSADSPRHGGGGLRPASLERPGRSRGPQLVASRSYRDGHPDEGADAVRVVGDLDVPDPGGSALVAGAGDGVDMPLGDRPQEGGAVRLAHGGHSLLPDPEPGGRRAHALGHRRVDAAVDEPDRLADVVGDRHPRADLVRAGFQVLEPDQVPEAVAARVAWRSGIRGQPSPSPPQRTSAATSGTRSRIRSISSPAAIASPNSRAG